MSRRYRVFFDESGDRSNRIDNSAASRYFALCGCVFLMESYRNDFRPAVDRLRNAHFPEHHAEEPVILHREEIKEARGSFAALQDDARRRAFDVDLLSLIGDANYQVITVLLDKRVFFARNGRGADPHSACLWELLKVYCTFLISVGGSGDVMGEARDQHLDRSMKESYEFYWNECEQQFTPASPLSSSNELKLKIKAHDITGIQLADLLAYPLKQRMLFDRGILSSLGTFSQEIHGRVESKSLERVALFLQA